MRMRFAHEESKRQIQGSRRRGSRMTDFPNATSPKPRAAILRMKEYHPPLGDRDGLRLDFNENTFECSPAVLQALHTFRPANLTRYPERQPAEALVAQHLGLE